MIRRPSRTSRIGKWIGLATCLLITMTWICSLWMYVEFTHGNFCVAISTGCIEIPWFGVTDGWDIWSHAFNVRWLPELKHGNPRISPFSNPLGVLHPHVIPLWIPLLFIAVPTFILWRGDRRYPPGYCRHCGYDLTGNVSGVCPECGARME